MKYITKKDSETGKKFQEITEKRSECFDAQKEIAEKYGFSSWRGGWWTVYGSISSFCNPINTPDSKIWGKGVEKGEFMPKKSSKVGLAIREEIKAMPHISYEDLNLCVGWEADFKHIGYDPTHDEYFGILVDEKWKIKMPSDCEEVTTTRYNEMFKTSNDE